MFGYRTLIATPLVSRAHPFWPLAGETGENPRLNHDIPLRSDHSRNLLAARPTGALGASCLRCFGEALFDPGLSRFGIERLPPKSCVLFCLGISEDRFCAALRHSEERADQC